MEALLRHAIANLPDGFAIWDADDRLVICNQHYRDIFSGLDELLSPGVGFETITSAVAKTLLPKDRDTEAWLRVRLPRRRDPNHAGTVIELSARVA